MKMYPCVLLQVLAFRAPTQGQVNVVNTQTTLVDGQLTQAQTLPGFKLGARTIKA